MPDTINQEVEQNIFNIINPKPKVKHESYRWFKYDFYVFNTVYAFQLLDVLCTSLILEFSLELTQKQKYWMICYNNQIQLLSSSLLQTTKCIQLRYLHDLFSKFFM